MRIEANPLAERGSDLLLWLALLALFGFACDPDALWMPIRFGNWATSLFAG